MQDDKRAEMEFQIILYCGLPISPLCRREKLTTCSLLFPHLTGFAAFSGIWRRLHNAENSDGTRPTGNVVLFENTMCDVSLTQLGGKESICGTTLNVGKNPDFLFYSWSVPRFQESHPAAPPCGAKRVENE
jgi:hypothetical protein